MHVGTCIILHIVEIHSQGFIINGWNFVYAEFTTEAYSVNLLILAKTITSPLSSSAVVASRWWHTEEYKNVTRFMETETLN